MLGFLTSDFAYQNRMMLLQHLIECGDVLLGKQYVYGLDNRIPHSRSSASPDVVKKDLGLSESDDEAPATTTKLEPILSPIGSGGSPSSGSESSPSDSESESSSAESSAAAPQPHQPQPQPPQPQLPAPAPVPPPLAPAQRTSWGLSNFVPPTAAQPPDVFEASSADLRHALNDVKGKPSPISELSDSEASSPSPGAARRRRSLAARASAASSDEDAPRHHHPVRAQRSPAAAAAPGGKRGRPPKQRAEERPAKIKRGPGRPRKPPAHSPAPVPASAAPAAPAPAAPDSDPEPEPAHAPALDTKTFIFRKVFTPKKGDEGGGKGGKGGKGKGGKGKGQVTIIEVTAPECDDERRHRERSSERRNEEAMARVSPPQEPETLTRRREAERVAHERIQERVATDRTAGDRLPPDRDRDRDRRAAAAAEQRAYDRLAYDRMHADRLAKERAVAERLVVADKTDRLADKRERLNADKSHDRLAGDKSHDRMSSDKSHDRMSSDKSHDRLSDKMSMECLPGDKMSLERVNVVERYVRAEADVGSGLKSGRGSERLEDASSNGAVVGGRRARVLVQIALSRLRGETLRALQRPARRPPAPRAATPPVDQGVEAMEVLGGPDADAGRSPIFYSYFERLPPDVLSDDDRDHAYYMEEAKRMRTAAESEQEPLARVMLYHESVLCFVLTGRLHEMEMDTKKAFTIYRETIEYIKSIHSMPQRFRTSPKSPHSTFSKLDILSLRVQSLLYLRMFKMYNREVKEYNKVVQEYQQKPACAESVSPLSPPPPAMGLAAASGANGYCSLVHSVPAHAHHALLQLTKYYTFLYVAHELWEQADMLCRLRANQDLFIAVDRKCGPLTLFSTFRHLVQYVRHAMSLLKTAPRE